VVLADTALTSASFSRVVYGFHPGGSARPKLERIPPG
jgi:hypothetical protein